MVDLEKFSLVKQGAEARLYTGEFLGQEVVVSAPQLGIDEVYHYLIGEMVDYSLCYAWHH